LPPSIASIDDRSFTRGDGDLPSLNDMSRFTKSMY